MGGQAMAGPNGEWVPCPQCQSTLVDKPSFTWWGGVLGPKIICHIKCNSCGHTYNGKTGGSNNGAIAIYMVVVSVIALGLMTALAAI